MTHEGKLHKINYYTKSWQKYKQRYFFEITLITFIKPSSFRSIIFYFLNLQMGCSNSIDVQAGTQGPFSQGNNFEKVQQNSNSNKDLLPQKNHNKVSPENYNFTQEICKKFKIAELMEIKLRNKTYTSEKLLEIVKVISQCINEIQMKEDEKEKKIITQNLQNSLKTNNEGKLFYHQVVQTVLTEKIRIIEQNKQKTQQNGFKSKEISTEGLSRIYHSIANLKKGDVTESIKQKKHEIDIINEANSYNKLTPEQLQYVVKLEAIGAKVQQLGARMRMKYGSLQNESRNIINLLADCLSRYHEDILQFKYELQEKEVMKVAEISREACNFHDSGVVLLLIYLVKSCKTLQGKKSTVQEIEKKMQEAISKISKKYPPGQGLKQEQSHLKSALQKLKFQDKFSHQPEKLTQEGKKQDQLENIIMKYAKIAQKNRNDFEDLVRQTCFKLSLEMHMGLKLNPNKPNKKAMVRIKEKMLFGKTQTVEKKVRKNIQQALQGEQSQYRNKIDKILEEKNEILFKISDMVRGKCVFSDINDILLAIDLIKGLVKSDKKKRFRITEIQSRFTNSIPISDITLKIALNEEIVAELQLTVQANAAAYNFAHKVYQLSRTKVFSKIKISHNYFQEFAGDFKQMSWKALHLSEEEMKNLTEQEKENLSENSNYLNKMEGKLGPLQKYYVIFTHSSSMKEYIDLSGIKVLNFEEAVEKVLTDRKNPLPKLIVSTDAEFQGIMIPIFNMEMGVWSKELGKEINSVLQAKGQYSDLLKATLLDFFFQKFDLSKQVVKMVQFFSTYQQITSKLGFNLGYSCDNTSIRGGVKFMEIYLNEIFLIQKPFDYAKLTARIYYKTIQAQSIFCTKEGQNSSPLLNISRFVLGVVIEENSIENITTLFQYLESYFINSHQFEQINYKMIQTFNKYYQWLMQILGKYKRFDSELIKCSAELLNVQLLLQEKKHEQAQKILLTIAFQFKEKQQMEKWLQCQLLLAECKANSIAEITDFKIQYEKVENKAKALGLEMKGRVVANSEWRIYKQIYKKAKSKEEKTYVEQKHLRKSLTESNRTEAQPFIQKMFQANLEVENVFQLFTNMKNGAVQSINWVNKNFPICNKILKLAGWKNLKYLNLHKNRITKNGCSFLRNAGWKNLTTLNLDDNNIGAEGCEHLSKAGWNNLTTLNLHDNYICNEGCAHLSNAGWINLTFLNLRSNNIFSDGCAHLSKASWKNLTTLYLNNNCFGNKGCAQLIIAPWTKLTTLQIGSCCITDEGCAHLSKTSWTNLTELNLMWNKIGDQGCAQLSKAQWTNLSSLNLNNCEIGNEGCSHLSKVGWKNFTKLNLGNNNINDEGCLLLCQAVWKNFTYLSLKSNKFQNNNKWYGQFNKLWPNCKIQTS